MKDPYILPDYGRRYLLWVVLGFMCGIAFGISYSISRLNVLALMGYGVALLFAVLLITQFLSRFRFFRFLALRDARLTWFVLLFFLLGMFRVYCFERLEAKSLLESAGVQRNYYGVVIGEPTLSHSEKTRGFPMKILAYQNEDQTQISCSGKIMVYAPLLQTQSIKEGDTLSFSATLTPPSDGAFFGDFSNRQYLYRQNYRFMVYTKQLTPVLMEYQPTFGDRILSLGTSVQNSILSSVDSAFGKDSPEGALLKGILLGIREDISSEQYQSFVNSGLIHITAVSGMHIMFLSGFLLFLLKKFRFPDVLRKLILLPILILFSVVASLTPSVCRATIMMILFLSAGWVQRNADSLTSLFAAAFFLLITNPYTLTSYSFLLSFSSTLGILLFTQPIRSLLLSPFSPKDKKEKKSPASLSYLQRFLLNPCISSMALSLGSLIGIGYLGMRLFQRITWGSILANLCLLPFSSAAFLLGLLNWPVISLVPELGTLIAQYPLRLLLQCINLVAKIFSHPIFRIDTPTPPLSGILPYLFFCFALYQLLNRKAKNNS